MSRERPDFCYFIAAASAAIVEFDAFALEAAD